MMNGKTDDTSTFEMQTRENFDKILQAIGGLRQDSAQRLDKIEQRLDKIEAVQAKIRKEFRDFKDYAEIQFEAIRQGLVKNYNQFDRLESQIAENRSVIFSTKPLLGELNERVFLLTKSTEQALR